MAATTIEQPIYETFDPVKLGKKLRLKKDKENKPLVTILLGAGCSKSAGIPLAGEITRELREEAKKDPLLEGIGSPPQGVSEYAFLMGKLGSSKERADHIKEYVDRARDRKGRIQINWTHLLLATMVEHGYVYRILTTNFDPLIVDALAIMGQPIRTFDLNTTGNYFPGTLDTASIIYLHGQMHNLFLANSEDEINRVRKHYPPVLQEAVQDSFLIVLGYSGDCDPVLDSLRDLPKFPRGLWWSHYGNNKSIGEGVTEVFKKHGTDCHLVEDLTSDLFMKKLVIDGIGLDYPDEIVTPISASLRALERITKFPIVDIKEPDPVAASKEFLNEVERQIPTVTKMKEAQRVIQIEMAASKGDWKEFENLIKNVGINPHSHISQVIGDGFLQRIWRSTAEDKFDDKVSWLKIAENYGQTSENKPWLPIAWGNVLLEQARFKGNTPEGDNLFTEAYKKYAEAVKIKPDKHEAFYNWGNALSHQAELKGNTPEGDSLFAEAYKKYAEAVKIKPDKHEAFNNWGVALLDQAKLKGNTPEGDNLFTEAYKKYAEAVRIKPDKHEAFFNWGISLLDQAKLKGNTPEGDSLFTEAYQKYAEAVKIKPDKHEAFYNWAIALLDQARLKGNTPEGDNLFTEAYKKYAEAVRIKPDMHEAFNNWGFALSDQAKLKNNPSERESLFNEASQKFIEVVRIRPDEKSAYYNVACIYALKNDIIHTLEYLESWLKYNPDASKNKLDNDTDFDKIREVDAFINFREKLK
jgi:tetratricopeptide (TPR) repeat protein